MQRMGTTVLKAMRPDGEVEGVFSDMFEILNVLSSWEADYRNAEGGEMKRM